MMTSYLDVVVEGRPATLTAKGEEWKTRVSQRCADAWTRGPIEEVCSVQLDFSVEASWLPIVALHNLLKQTIDGMGRAVFLQSPSGQPGPWGTDDWWITALRATKSVGAPGVRIRLSGTPIVEPHAPFARFEVSGRPAPWITSREKAWIQAIAAATQESLPAGRADDTGVQLDFRIGDASMRTTDIDNLCVPALQGVHRGLVGPYIQGAPNHITEFYATKSVDPSNLGVTIQLFQPD